MTNPPRPDSVEAAPRRLLEGQGPAAEWLEAALQAKARAGSADFSALLAARGRQRLRRRIAYSALSGVMLLGAVWWAGRTPAVLPIAPEGLAMGPDEASDSSMGANHSRARAGLSREVSEEETVSGVQERTEHPPSDEPNRSRQSAAAISPSAATASGSSASGSVVSGSTGARDGASARSEERCPEWVQRGDYAAAIGCYERKAQGDGTAAEWALLEKARIQSRALGRPEDALETLNEYERRFPHGALAREALPSRIELLTAVGQPGAARHAIDAALKEDRVPERRGELLLLRAQLNAEQGDCSEVANDLARAREAGVPSKRVASVSARCGGNVSVD